MPRPFHQQIEDLRASVLRMGELAKQSLLDGVMSLRNLDMDLADQVLARDDALNRLDVEIEATALDLLALNQPVAKDLRTIGASLKIITYLDRIGRYGYDIAEIARSMEGRSHPAPLVTIPHMADLVSKMVEDALAAYRDADADKARSVFPQDDLVDALNDQILRECITRMVEDVREITVYTSYILVARHLERAADNADKVAEKVLYIITGERRVQV